MAIQLYIYVNASAEFNADYTGLQGCYKWSKFAATL